MHTKYFISDTHCGHTNILKYDGRPFATIEEHDTAIVDNINNTLKSGDHLYHLGDVAWSQAAFDLFMDRLRKDILITFIKGNHDPSRIKIAKHWPDVLTVKEDEHVLWLSHYPHISWPNSFHGSIHLYGHVHGIVGGHGRSLEVSANVIDYRPISLAEVVKRTEHLTTHC